LFVDPEHIPPPFNHEKKKSQKAILFLNNNWDCIIYIYSLNLMLVEAVDGLELQIWFFFFLWFLEKKMSIFDISFKLIFLHHFLTKPSTDFRIWMYKVNG
jgi:hypothetical protein